MSAEAKPPVDLLELDIDIHEAADMAAAVLSHVRRSDLTRGALSPARARAAALLARRGAHRLLDAARILDHRSTQEP